MVKRALMVAVGVVLLALPVHSDDAYDMGKIQVVGKDAQYEKFSPSSQKILMQMGDRSLPMPEIVPEPRRLEVRPLEDKPFIPESRKRITDQLSISLGAGTRGSRELGLAGKGSYDSYIGHLDVARSSKDGFRSQTDDTMSFGRVSLSSAGRQSYTLSGSGELGAEEFGLRGTLSNPTPHAKISDRWSRFSLKGHSTLDDGAFVSGNFSIDSVARETRNRSTGYSQDGDLFSGDFAAEYSKSLSEDIKGRAGVSVTRNNWEVSNAANQSFTKRVLSLSGEYEFSDQSFLEVGGRSIHHLGKDRFAPFVKYDHRWGQSWQLILNYSEDLGNDNMKDVFLARRYVETSKLRASTKKDLRATLNVRYGNGNILGADLFREKESDALEFVDVQDAASGLLASRIRFVPDAERTGLRLRGSFRIEDHFTLDLAHTYQAPEDTRNKRRLSYEPKRILDIRFGYAKDRLQVDFSRNAQFDRIAYTPVAAVDAGDYSRSDLVLRYNINDRYNAYMKIKDLYNEAKSLRFAVPEEGRVSLLGVEANF